MSHRSATRNVYSYRCFGLNLLSEVDLPGLPHSAEESDVVVRSVPPGLARYHSLDGSQSTSADDDGVLLHWTQFGSARIRNGCEITLYPLPGVSDSLVRHVIQGPAMGVLLHQRGYSVLHASAVSIGGSVVAFVGPKGAGKSTTAAALHSRGHRLVTDDLLAVRAGPDGCAYAAPGVPMLKLWEDSVRAGLGEDPASMPLFQPEKAKRTRWVDADDDSGPLPLKVIYSLQFLDGGARDFAIEKLPPIPAFFELVRHSYLHSLLGDQTMTGVQMPQLGAVLNDVAVRRLSRVRSLDDLAGLAVRIERDYAG